MQLGEVIRKYRKDKNMTQEEMAGRLGVTAPAVNKWENGNSFPDIMLLAPIARLLGISLDTLLSFREELTPEEITEIVREVSEKLKEQPYDEAVLWAKKKLEQYPNSEQLIWQIALILDAWRTTKAIPYTEKYDGYIYSLYTRALESEDEIIRSNAADSLFGFYMRKKQYEKAEACLDYFSKQNPERKRKQAQLYSETDRIQEAYKTYEELLFACHGMVSMTLHGMYMLALQEKDMERAHMLAAKEREMSGCFEMGKSYGISSRLEIATLEKDTETVIATMEEMLAGVEQMDSFRESLLYEHMEFKEVGKDFLAEFKKNMLKCFQDEESYGFLKNDKRWQELVKEG